MRRVTIFAAAVISIVSGCGDTTDSGVAAPSINSWRFVSLAVDGETFAVEQPLFLDITENGFSAATTCNTISGQFGGDQMMTAMGCSDAAANEGERYMLQAFGIVPIPDGDQLVFDDGDVRLVYEAFVDPRPADLFAVLGDPNASVDESMLPPEQATGTVPPDFEALVPIPSPSGDLDLFLAEFDGNICLVYGTATSMNKACSAPRFAAERSFAIDIPIYEQPIARVAMVPDRFGPAAAGRPDLGRYESNVLIVRADVPEGKHTLTDDEGNTLLLLIPPPWTDPMAASRTDPEG